MTRREVTRVPVADLHPDPDQVRRTFDEGALLALGATLREKQIHPVLAYRKDGVLRLSDGERRWRAAKLVGLTELDVLVVEEPKATGQTVWQQAVAGIHCEELAPCEKARALKRLMDETGATAADAAKRFGLSAATATRLLVLLALPDAVQAQIDRGQVPASTAYEIAREPDPTARQGLLDGVAAGTLTRAAVVRRRATREAPQVESARLKRATAVLGGGRQVTFSGADALTMAQIIEMAEDVLAKARKFRNRGVELATFLAQLKLDAKVEVAAGQEEQP